MDTIEKRKAAIADRDSILKYLKKKRIKFLYCKLFEFWISSEVKHKQLRELIALCEKNNYKIRFTEIQLHIYKK